MSAVLDNRLSYVDQALFLAVRATGQEPVMQCVWVYDDGLDLDAVRRFHQNLGAGLIGRRIERSPLPFARHRWITSPGPACDLDVATEVRPRAQLSDWADSRVRQPVDPEFGPGWRLCVAFFDDGSAAISMVVSHCLTDGIGGMLTLVNAVLGSNADFGYPLPNSRTRRQAAWQDAWQTARELPEVARAVSAIARMATDGGGQGTQPQTRRGTHGARTTRGDADETVVVPTVSVHIDYAHWAARAAELGGTPYALMAGIASLMGQRMGRARASDGMVTLLIPTNDRAIPFDADGNPDTRANAVAMAKVPVDPTGVASDLSAARATLREALKTAREEPDPALQALPLTPFVPKWGIKKMADMLLGFGDLPVSCSNVGEFPDAIRKVGGGDASRVVIRGLDRHIPRSILERVGGQLTLVGGRIGDEMMISVVAFQAFGVETKPQLRALADDVLAEFGLTGSVV